MVQSVMQRPAKYPEKNLKNLLEEIHLMGPIDMPSIRINQGSESCVIFKQNSSKSQFYMI